MQTNVAMQTNMATQTPAPNVFYPFIMIQPDVAQRIGDVKATLVLQVIHEQLVSNGIKDSDGRTWTTMNSDTTLSGCNVQQIIDKLVADGYLNAKNTGNNTVMYTIEYNKI